MKRMYRPICWWFGCAPHYEAVYYDAYQDAWSEPPCKRCGALECLYSDLVGDTRHARAQAWLTGLLRRQQPANDFNDSVPF